MINRFITENLTVGMSSYLFGRVVAQESAPARRMTKRTLRRRKKTPIHLRDLSL